MRDLEAKVKDQEEELDEQAGNIQMLEQVQMGIINEPRAQKHVIESAFVSRAAAGAQGSSFCCNSEIMSLKAPRNQ